MTRLEIRPLIHFLAVIDECSLGRAAKRINLSQPALSKSIRQLEVNLGVELFELSASGMKPTRYSTVLAERARLIVAEANNAQEEFDQLCDRWRGTVTIGAGPSIVGTLLARTVADLKVHHPDLRVSVVEGMLENHLPDLRKGSMDFVIGTAVETVPETVVAELLFRDTVVIAARAGHPLIGERTITLARLACFPFVVTRAPEILRHALERRFGDRGLAFPIQTVETNSIQFMKALAMASDHLAYLPRLAFLAEAKEGSLVPLAVPEAEWQREVHVLRRARGTLSPAARAMLHSLKRACLVDHDRLI